MFNHFPEYRVKILADFNAELRPNDIFKLAFGNESLHQDSNDNCVRVVNFEPAKNLVKSTMFLHLNSHNYIWTCPGGKTHNQIDHILMDRRWQSSILGVQSFRRADWILIIIWRLQKLENDCR